jgi:hypothetical protein
VHATTEQKPRIPRQVPAVGRQRVRGEATLDRQVIEKRSDGSVQIWRRVRGRERARIVLGQESTSARGVVLSPWASATGP